jgi:hypothetical protein
LSSFACKRYRPLFGWISRKMTQSIADTIFGLVPGRLPPTPLVGQDTSEACWLRLQNINTDPTVTQHGMFGLQARSSLYSLTLSRKVHTNTSRMFCFLESSPMWYVDTCHHKIHLCLHNIGETERGRHDVEQEPPGELVI